MEIQPSSLRKSLVRFADLLGEALERDPELLTAFADLVREIRGGSSGEGESFEESASDEPDAEEQKSLEENAPSPDPATADQLADFVETFPALASLSLAAAETTAPLRPRVSPRIVAERCRLKQRACDLAVELDESFEVGGRIVPHDEFQPIIEQAKALPDCFLWMLRPETRGWIDASAWETLGRCFANLAQAMLLADAVIESDESGEAESLQALQLAAEAQRAVRQAVVPCVPRGRNFEDSDQLSAYRWIAEQCDSLRIFVPRYLKIDDLADPEGWRDLGERLAAVERRRSERTDLQRFRGKLYGKIRYEAQRLVNAAPPEAEQRVEKISQTTAELVGLGVPPSDTKLRDLLVPVFDLLVDSPVEGDPAFQLVLREIDHYLAGKETESRENGREDPETQGISESKELGIVREWLRGRTLVIVGGEERPEAIARIVDAFALDKLDWIATRPHESTEGFRAPVQRPDVALVVLAIRWSSHSYGGIRDYCEAAGKPLVRLPGGYGVNRLAAEIIAQASDAFQ